MNERIRRLSEQAHRSTADELAHLQRVHNRTYDLYESAAIYNEKFAELIVKKCMDVAKHHTPDTEECEYTWLIHDKIQEYFGVEQ